MNEDLNKLIPMSTDYSKYGAYGKNVKSLSKIIGEGSEKDFFYRNRMPDLINVDFIKTITTATGGAFNGFKVPAADIGQEVAIIGAGAAGLCAGYELMKLGLKPIYFEMQEEKAPSNATFARPMGRGYSWDFAAGTGGGGAFTNWCPTKVAGPEPVVNENVYPANNPRNMCDMGAMRYPNAHTSLHRKDSG